MVSLKSVELQLKAIHFNSHAWGRSELAELPNILMPDEQIYECVNGLYEGGFALLCATNVRLILIDQKPLKFLTVEDLRFDMINQIDYSHRLFGAQINVSVGNKNLSFRSYNQKRLRKLINHIQQRMAEVKHEQSSSAETQQQHLERINQQLQAYLMTQHQQQQDLQKQLEQATSPHDSAKAPEVILERPVQPSPELADYLFAQSLMQQYRLLGGNAPEIPFAAPSPGAPIAVDATQQASPVSASVVAADPIQAVSKLQIDDLADAGRQEIFGAKMLEPQQTLSNPLQVPLAYLGLEVNPLRVAYAKLPMLLRSRRFGRHSSRSASQAKSADSSRTQPAGA